MKKQFIKTLHSGDTVDDFFVLSEKSLSHKKDGNPYLNISISDKTGTIKGVVWDNVDQLKDTVKSGVIVQITGSVSEYNGKLQLIVKDMREAPETQIEPGDFIPATSRNVDSMFERLVKLTESMKNEQLKQLLQAFWNDPDFVLGLKTAPGAKKMHHAYLGGLLEHTLSMSILVGRIAGHYSGIDMDLLLTGAILHDIGKIREFDYKFKIDYSTKGRLLNHIVIGCCMLDEKLSQLAGFPEELSLLLKHLILSHHGTREFGSPEPPKTIEAVLLNFIDEIDAKVNGIREFMSAQESDGEWTSYHKLLERHFYKGKIEAPPMIPSTVD